MPKAFVGGWLIEEAPPVVTMQGLLEKTDVSLQDCKNSCVQKIHRVTDAANSIVGMNVE